MTRSLPADEALNTAQLLDAIAPLREACVGRAVFLVDGDRTLSPDDTSRTFLRLAGQDPQPIKERFMRDGYCFETFRYHTQVHLSLGEATFEALCPRVAQDTALYAGAVDFLRLASARGAVFVVSAGIPGIWRCVLDAHGLDAVGVIGGIDPQAPYVLGRAEKGLIAHTLLEHARCLIAVGDSDVDAAMLRAAHHAVIVVNHQRNRDLLAHLHDHPSCWQIAPAGEAHDGIPCMDFPAIARLSEHIPHGA